MSNKKMVAIVRDTQSGSNYTESQRIQWLDSPGKNRGNFKASLDLNLPTTEQVDIEVRVVGKGIAETRGGIGLERLFYKLKGLLVALDDIKWAQGQQDVSGHEVEVEHGRRL